MERAITTRLAIVGAIALGACSTVLGLEDHEAYPEDAAGVDSSLDAAPDQSLDAPTDTPSESASDAASDVVDATSDDGPPPPRVNSDIVVLYTFDEGSGNTVKDVSGNGTPLDLKIKDLFLTEWHPGYLKIKSSTIVASATPATKIYNACTASEEITVEAWVTPASTTQIGPARIVTFSPNTNERNFTLAQDNDQYFMRLRTSVTTSNGEPPVLTLPGTLTTELTHVLYTRAKDATATIYLNGTIQGTGKVVGNLSPWVDTNKLGLANEHTLDRVWFGDLHLVAVYSRALTKEEAIQNFQAGAD